MPESVAPLEPVVDTETQAVAVIVGETVGEADEATDVVGDPVPERHPVALADAVRHCDALAVPLETPEPVAVTRMDAETDALDVAERVTSALVDVTERVGALDFDGEPEMEGVRVALALPLAVPVAVAQRDCDADADGEPDADGLKVGATEPDDESVWDGDADSDLAPLEVCDVRGERVDVVVTEPLGDGRADDEGDTVPVGVCCEDAVTVAEYVSVSVDETVGEGDEAAEGDEPPDGDALAESEYVCVGEALSERVAAGEADDDGAADAEPERRGDGEGDEEADAVRTEADAVTDAVGAATVRDTVPVVVAQIDTVTDHETELDAVDVGASDGDSGDVKDWEKEDVTDGEPVTDPVGEPESELDAEPEAEPETDGEPESVKETVAAEVELALPLAVGAPEPVRETEGEAEGDDAADADALPVATLLLGAFDAVPEPQGEPEPERAPDGETESDDVTVDERLSVGVVEPLPQADADAQTVGEPLPVAAALVDGTADEERTTVTDPE